MKPVADLWFSIDAYPHNILLIRESHIDPYAVGDIWIVRGSERDLVIDSGCGMVSPVPLIETIASKPLIAIALNASYDHAGGWHGFSDRACHPLSAPKLANINLEDAEVSKYLTDEMLWALPEQGYQMRDYSLTAAEPTQLVNDGDVIDLGNRQLEAMHVPGRSAGGLAVWEAATGSLFTSDMLYDGDHGLAWPPASPEEYCSSLKRFRQLPVETVYTGHYGVMHRQRMLEVINEQLADLEPA
jgi:glyoxylase-like metal-dependent hydrolase (beta-lactamase superfamily II)